MADIILASSSPRRLELLRRIGIAHCRVIPPACDEEYDETLPPEDAVMLLSRRKAMDIAASASPADLIIAADTLVWHNGRALGKPVDADDAFSMLTALSGSLHAVYTGVTVLRGDAMLTEAERTSVLLRAMTAEEIRLYVATGEPMDKAGSYGIQERGALLCERVDGDFYNVMGLPLFRLGRMLGRMGVHPLFEEALR